MNLLSNFLIYSLFPILTISVVVVIHELGHYWAGRWFGAAANSFSIGFGSTVLKRTDKRGTIWKLNWLPLGGYVSFVDENEPVAKDDNKVRPIGKSFMELSVLQRSIIAIAGPAANFVLAIAIFAGFSMTLGDPKYEVQVEQVEAGSPAEQAGVLPGDVFLKVNGQDAQRYSRFLNEIRLSAGNEIHLLINRGGREVSLTATPQKAVLDNGVGIKQKMGKLGVRLKRPVLLDQNLLNPVEAVAFGVDKSYYMISSSLRMLGKIVTGKEDLQTLSGPVGIANAVGTTARVTLEQKVDIGLRLRVLVLSLLEMCAMISVAVGFFNLLPLPVLDGGRLVFNAYEAVTGRLPSDRIQAVSMTLTLAFLILMALFITIGDFQETGLIEVFRGL
jgi:Predicted membrane-associated Zn-dependent proteases 1